MTAMNPTVNVGFAAAGDPLAAGVKPRPLYAPVSSGVWTSQPGMMNEPNMYTQSARYPMPTQETYSSMMMPPMSSAGIMGAAMNPQMLAMMNHSGPPMNSVLMNLELPASSFNKAINFSKQNDGAAGPEHDLNHNGYMGAYGSMPDQRHLDAENSLAEQAQSREQAQLLEQFKHLRQWQQQQQAMLLQQQQAQLFKLQEEQHMIQKMISKQRQAQWGGAPQQGGYAQNDSVMEGFGSPKKSTIPQALAHGAMAMPHLHPMQSQMQVIQGQGGYPMHPSDMIHDEEQQDLDDADSTIIESASLYADNDGVAPLPGSEEWHAQEKLLARLETASKSTPRNTAQTRDSDEYESEDDVESNASGLDMEEEEEQDYHDNQNDEDDDMNHFNDTDEEEGKPFTKPQLSRHKEDYHEQNRLLNNDESDGDEEINEPGGGTPENQEEQAPEEQPIVSRHKTFEALLEEELQKEREEMLKVEESKKSGGKRKLPFLRKGQGIARFGLFKSLRRSLKGGKGSTKESPVASTPVRPVKTGDHNKKADERKPQKESSFSSMSSRFFGKSSHAKPTVNKSVSETVLNTKPSGPLPASKSSSQLATLTESSIQLPPSAPGSKVSAAGSKVARGVINDKSIEEKSNVLALKKPSSVLSQGTNSSFQKKKIEQEELEEFEILEQFADDNASFLSNMSAVNRAIVSKKSERSGKPTTTTGKPTTSSVSNITSQMNTENRAPEKQTDIDDDEEDIRSEELSNSEADDSEEDEVKEKDRDEDKSDCDDTMQQEDDDNDDSDEEEDELMSSKNSRVSYDLPRKLAKSSGSSYPPKSTTQSSGVSQLNKVMHWSESESERGQDEREEGQRGQDKANSDSCNSSGSQATPSGPDIDYGDDEEWPEPDTPIKRVGGPQTVPAAKPVITKSKVSPVSINRPGYDSPPPTSQLVNKLFPSLKQEQAKLQQKKQEEMAEKLEATRQAGTSNDGVQSKLIRDKLMQLENEIEKFKSENATLNRLRKEREEGLQELKKEMTEFEKQKDEELKRLQEFKAEETKKLKREKKQFEEYKKATKTLPDKKEREEIEALKKQVADLQEEMKRKESRWTSNNSRLRNRIEELETENQELKEEVRIMEKRRLEQWQQSSGNKNNVSHSKSNTKLPQTSPMPESKPAQYNSHDNNALRLSNNMEQDSQDETMSDISDSSHLTTPSEAAAVRAAMPPVQLSFPSASGAAPGCQPTSMRTAAPQPFAQPDAMLSTGMRRSSEGHLPSIAMAASGAATPSVLSADGEGSRRGVQRKRALPINISNTIDKGEGEYEEVTHSDGKIEKLYSNGAREILFANGTRKQVSSDGQSIIVSFFNGDIKQILADQRVIYFYAEGQTTHTTYPDGLEILQFPNGQIEKHYPDGTKEITFPDQTMKYLFPNGSEESIFPDGMVIRQESDGQKVMEFPNGQREIHTSQYKRREYPDGTVKTVYPDGRQETRYSSGRLRVKDKNGSVLVDKRM